jgi:hypothetical protein
MSADCFSKRIGRALAVRTDLLLGSDPASSSDGDGKQLASTDGAVDISHRLQALLEIRAQLSDSSDSSDGDPLFTDNPRLAALFSQPRSGADNNNILRALGEVVSNSGGAGKNKKKKKKSLQSSEEDTVDSIHPPTEENRSNTEDEFVPDSPGVTFERDPSDDVGEVTRDNDAGESLP